MFDLVRIDHFRGFVAYWAVPEGARTARSGSFKRGPGRAPFDAAMLELGSPLPIVAEDLGVITPPVERLRDSLGLPGMLVLQFAFEPDEPESVHRFEKHVEHRVVYTGTHDGDTARGWFESLSANRRELFEAELSRQGIRERQPWWALIRLAFASPARVAMVQAQDVLGLGSEARMNVPARASGNWRWRLAPGALNGRLASRLRAVTEEAGRLATADRRPPKAE
jgi:4-alpha-glucanotransferase